MENVIIAIAANSIFAQIYKWAQLRHFSVDHLNTLTFGTSAIVAFLLWARNPVAPSFIAMILGLAAGICNYVSVVTFFKVVAYGALSVSWTVIALAILVPIVIGAVFWDEKLNVIHLLALIAAITSIVLMGNVELRRIAKPSHWAFWLILAYTSSGLEISALKALDVYGSTNMRSIYLLTDYVMGLILCLVVSLQQPRATLREIGLGLLRGASVVASNAFLLQAVHVLPGYLVFPIYGVGNTVMTVFASAMLWKETFPMKVRIGLVPALLSVVLLSGAR